MSSPERRPFVAVVMAAGHGTRMKSRTPKVVHPVAGLPMATHVLRAAHAAGAARAVLIVGAQSTGVADVLQATAPPLPVAVAVQDPPRGTGDAVRAALEALGHDHDTAVILNGDIPCITAAAIERMVAAQPTGGLALASMRLEDPTGYGRVLRGAGGAPTAIREHRDCTEAERKTDEVNIGLYVAPVGMLRRLVPALRCDNDQGEYYLTDVVEMAHGSGAPTAAVCFDDASDLMGVNDRVHLAQAERRLQQRRLEALMREGVTVVDPARVDVGPDVVVGQDTVLERGVSLRGRTRIGAGCVIGHGAVLTDATLGDDVEIRPYSVLESAAAERGAVVGPFARLRPGTVLRDGAFVGNFVEMKKTDFGPGSKAGHLSYLGDASIGAGVNVGAGTITCNYDGTHKHRTVLGDGVFIGSDTQLVAPVTIGEEGYVGAGTTVTADVPAGALAISRAPQKNLEGWVARKRARLAARDGAAPSADEGAP